MYKPIENKSNYHYIVEQIKQMILDEELVVGDRLPAERDLTEMFQVSRASVREALKALESMGLLESRHGGGNYIVNHLKEQMPDNLSMIFVLDHCKMRDLTTLRHAFEMETMRGIVQKNDPAVQKQLEALAERVRNAKTIPEIEEIDMDFHALVSSLAANPLMQYLQASIHTVYLRNIEFLNTSYPDWNSVPFEETQDYQLDIINALLSRDMLTIEKALLFHYSYHSDLDIEALYEEYRRKKKRKHEETQPAQDH